MFILLIRGTILNIHQNKARNFSKTIDLIKGEQGKKVEKSKNY